MSSREYEQRTWTYDEWNDANNRLYVVDIEYNNGIVDKIAMTIWITDDGELSMR